jgi:hypothetical protein
MGVPFRVAAVAKAAPVLLRAMKESKDPSHLASLAQALSEVAAGLEPRDAAAFTAQAATALLQAMRDTKDNSRLHMLALGLSAVAARLEPQDAAPVATALLQAMKDTKGPFTLNWFILTGLAQGLSAVAARLEPQDAAAVSAQAATTLIQAMKETPQDLSSQSSPLGQSLARSLAAVAPADIPSRSATAASAVALRSGTGYPLTALTLIIPAAEPAPCRLSTQQLVELLKMPSCFGEARRIVLGQLGNRYRHSFRDPWEFVRFAREQHLDLDFTTPPQRPELATRSR